MGNCENKNIPLRVLASGNQITLPVWRFAGDEDGKNVYIQANIHGPEITGIGVCRELINKLAHEKIRGTVTLVPTANPVGLNSKINGLQVGYADLNDSKVGNFNREYQLLVAEKPGKKTDMKEPRKVDLKKFVAEHLEDDVGEIIADFRCELRRSVAEIKAKKGKNGLRFGLKLALTLQELSLDSDVVIDLHTGNRATYFCYTFDPCLEAAKYFNITNLIKLEDEFEGVFDEAFLLPWLKLKNEFKEAGRNITLQEFGKEAFTLELGSADTLKPESLERDARRVVNYLRHKKILRGKGRKNSMKFNQCRHKDFESYYSPGGGLLLWNKKPGNQVQKGEMLARIIRPDRADDVGIPVVASEDGVLIDISTSHVVHEGLYLCGMMTGVRQA